MATGIAIFTQPSTFVIQGWKLRAAHCQGEPGKATSTKASSVFEGDERHSKDKVERMAKVEQGRLGD